MRIALFLFMAASLLASCTPATPSPAPTAVPTAAPTAAPTAPLAAGDTLTCSVEGSLPPVDPDEAARFAPVTDDDWILGDKNAKITLLEYSDFM